MKRINNKRIMDGRLVYNVSVKSFICPRNLLIYALLGQSPIQTYILFCIFVLPCQSTSYLINKYIKLCGGNLNPLAQPILFLDIFKPLHESLLAYQVIDVPVQIAEPEPALDVYNPHLSPAWLDVAWRRYISFLHWYHFNI